MAFKCLLGQSELDKLLLFHELGVWAIVYDIGAENGGRQGAVDLFGVEILVLSVEDEFVAVEAKVASDFLPEKNKRENVTVLRC